MGRGRKDRLRGEGKSEEEREQVRKKRTEHERRGGGR